MGRFFFPHFVMKCSNKKVERIVWWLSMYHQFSFTINKLPCLFLHTPVCFLFLHSPIGPSFLFFFEVGCRQQCTSFLNTSSCISLTGIQYLFMQKLYFTQEKLNVYIYFAKRKGCDSRRINTLHGWGLLGYLWKLQSVWKSLDLQKLLPYGAATPCHETVSFKYSLGKTMCFSVNVNWIWMWRKWYPEA